MVVCSVRHWEDACFSFLFVTVPIWRVSSLVLTLLVSYYVAAVMLLRSWGLACFTSKVGNERW